MSKCVTKLTLISFLNIYTDLILIFLVVRGISKIQTFSRLAFKFGTEKNQQVYLLNLFEG